MIALTISSPEKTANYEGLKSVTLPASSGKMQILTGHAECFLSLNADRIILKYPNDKKESVEFSGGECHIQNNRIIIFA